MMMTDTDRYIVEENIHGVCDLTGLEGSLVKVVGGYHLSRDTIPVVDSRADSLVYSGEFDEMEEAFKHVLDEHVGKTLILHFPEGDSPNETHTYTVKQAEGFEAHETGGETEIEVRHTDGTTATFTAKGVSVRGME